MIIRIGIGIGDIVYMLVRKKTVSPVYVLFIVIVVSQYPVCVPVDL